VVVGGPTIPLSALIVGFGVFGWIVCGPIEVARRRLWGLPVDDEAISGSVRTYRRLYAGAVAIGVVMAVVELAVRTFA